MNNIMNASFVYDGIKINNNNKIFNLDNPDNRDNVCYPFYLIRQFFNEYGIELNTPDLIQGKSTEFSLHLNMQDQLISEKNYLLMFEPVQIQTKHGNPQNWQHYRKIFTWNNDLADGNRFVKVPLPNVIRVNSVDGFENRNRFCCLIAGNKNLHVNCLGNLYVERVKAIRWFEQYAAKDFDLFGVGWGSPPARYGLLGKIEYKFYEKFGRLLSLRPFPSYQGSVKNKRDVLIHTRFSICYENISDLPFYITEKIFDSFCSGCIPVYRGANNVDDLIPPDCFIDLRHFHDIGEVYNFLKGMSESVFIGYQMRIADYLSSKQVYPFSSEYFAETVVNTILQDLIT